MKSGKKHSGDAKRKMSEARKRWHQKHTDIFRGENNPMYGKKPWNKGKEWEKIKFNIIPCPELSYLIGVHYGDMKHMKYEKKSQFACGLQSIDKEFVDEFRRCACIVVGKEPTNIWQTKDKRRIKPLYGWSIFSKKLYLFFSKTKAAHEFKTFIEKYPNDFLRGLWDSEGSITSLANYHDPCLRLAMSNKEIVIYSKKLLNDLGMDFKYYEFKSYRARIGKLHFYNNESIIAKKMLYTLATKKRKNIKLFYKKINFSIIRKQEKLNQIVTYKLIKSCISCGDEFEPNSNAQKFCNNCRYKNGKENIPLHM